MLSNDQEVLSQALLWRQAGQRCVLAPNVDSPPGAMAVISEQGLIVGSVSGGCVEDELVHEVRSGRLWVAPSPVALRSYGRDAAERERYRLPCGNALKLVLEPHWQTEVVEQALQHLAQRRPVIRALDYATGVARLLPHQGEQVFVDDEHGLRAVLGPRLRLLLIGATEVSRYLLPIAQSLGYAVSICDPRQEYTCIWPEPGVPLLTDMPDDAVLAFACDERTAVITVTHDPKLDDLALMEALKTPAFYVGALGSNITTSKRRERLRLFDLSEDQVAQLKGPVGLPIGSRSPAEIAVSIAAELIQLRRVLDAGGDPIELRQSRPAWMPASTGQGCGLVSVPTTDPKARP